MTGPPPAAGAAPQSSPVGSSPPPDPHPAADPTRRADRLALAALTLVVAGLHVWLARDVPGPSVILDEAGYLGSARWLAGEGPTFEMPVSPSYGFGYPLVLAPLHWAIDDPTLLWRAVLTLNALLLASLVPLLAAFARRVLGLVGRDVMAVAVAGALVPAATGAGVSAMSENLALPLLVAAALALHRAMGPGPLLRRVWFGPAVALLYASHPRYTTVVGVAAATLVVVGWRRMAPISVIGANLGALVVLVGGARTVQAAIVDDRWSMVDSLEGDLGHGVELVTDRTGLADLSTSAVGQAWYVVIGTLGLSVLGIGLLLALARGRVGGRSSEQPGGEPPDEATATGPLPADRARRATATVIVLAALGVFATSVLFFTRNQFRADHLIYGRHNDTFAPLWVASGLAVLRREEVRSRLLLWCSTAAATMVVLSFGLARLQDPTLYGGTYAYFSVPGISRVIGDPASGTYLRATVMGALGLLAITLVGAVARRPRWLVVPLIAWFVWSGIGRIEDVESFAGATYRSWNLPEQVAELSITEADLEADATRGATVLSYQFWMPWVDFDLYEPKLGEQAGGPFVFAPFDDQGLRERGAQMALIDDGGFYEFRGTPAGIALWVLPGPDQDRLDADGLLLPPGFPTALPRSAQRAELEIVDGPDVIRVEPGEAVRVKVRGRHTGTGAPWPDVDSHRGRSRVRIVAEVEPLDPANPLGARSGGELPAWIVPGASFTQEVEVHALGRILEPLPPGRYRVTLGIGQDEPAWFTSGGPDASFTLEVGPG